MRRDFGNRFHMPFDFPQYLLRQLVAYMFWRICSYCLWNRRRDTLCDLKQFARIILV